MTDEAEPTITRPITHSSARRRAARSRPHRCPVIGYRSGRSRAHGAPWSGARRTRTARGAPGRARRAVVVRAGAACTRRRHAHHSARRARLLIGPTPDARHSLPTADRSGGCVPGDVCVTARRWAAVAAPWDASCELRHRQVVAVEDPEAQGAEETAQHPEAHDHRRLGPPAELEVVVDRAPCGRCAGGRPGS